MFCYEKSTLLKRSNIIYWLISRFLLNFIRHYEFNDFLIWVNNKNVIYLTDSDYNHVLVAITGRFFFVNI